MSCDNTWSTRPLFGWGCTVLAGIGWGPPTRWRSKFRSCHAQTGFIRRLEYTSFLFILIIFMGVSHCSLADQFRSGRLRPFLKNKK